MSWNWEDVYDYDYEDTPEYMGQKVIDDLIMEKILEK